MKKMLIWETAPFISGGQRMTLTVMELLQNEYEFLCLIPSEGALGEELKRRGINYLCIGDQTLPAGVKGWKAVLRYGVMSVRSILKSVQAIRRFKPDVLYAPGPAALPWSAICGTLCGKPVVWHLHHIFTDGPTKKLLSFTGGWKAVRSIIAVSRVVGGQITSAAGQAKVHALYNPVDVKRYAAGNAACVLAEAGTALGRPIHPDGSCVVVEVALLRPCKMQDQTICVIGALKGMGVPVCGILVGGAVTADDKRFEASLRQQIAAQGLEADVYMPGQRSNIPDYLAAASVVLVPSPAEGLPLAALEAMSARRTVVAVEDGGASELLQEAGCGMLYPADATPEEIARTICLAWQSGQQEGVERGFDFCLAHDMRSYGEEIRRIFASVTGG